MELLNLRVLQEYKDDATIFVFKISTIKIHRSYCNQLNDYFYIYRGRFTHGDT